MDNYIFTNPNKKILSSIGNRSRKETKKKISTIINVLSNKITALNTKITGLNSKKPTLKNKRAKKVKAPIKESLVIVDKNPIEPPIKVNSWERKEIFKRINYKFIKEVINGQTGEIFNKSKDKPGLISKINDELTDMGNYDLFYLKVYDKFIVYEIIINGFVHQNNPENKPKPKNKK